jgi:hypothetical protein
MDITPGITHAVKRFDESLCGLECTSDWDEDDDAEFIYSNDITQVDCKRCLEILNDERER